MTVRDNDVRRRLAQDLHDLAERRRDDPDGVFDQELLCVLGVCPGNSDGFADPADVLRLARIVDRPTCRNVADPDDGGLFECSNCGETWELTCGGPDENHLFFCPRCGAEVVEDGDDDDGGQ